MAKPAEQYGFQPAEFEWEEEVSADTARDWPGTGLPPPSVYKNVRVKARQLSGFLLQRVGRPHKQATCFQLLSIPSCLLKIDIKGHF